MVRSGWPGDGKIAIAVCRIVAAVIAAACEPVCAEIFVELYKPRFIHIVVSNNGGVRNAVSKTCADSMAGAPPFFTEV